MADEVNAYRSHGDAAMVEYADTDTPVKSGDVFQELLGESRYLSAYDGDLRRHLAGYPASVLHGAADLMFWATDEVPGLRRVTSITHASFYTPPAESYSLLAEKQLYANHYFEGAITLTAAIDREGGVYIFRAYRARLDALPRWPFNLRGRVTGRLRDAVEADLTQIKALMERAAR
jgi:hypothetical protein